jgi:hypothetical protein
MFVHPCEDALHHPMVVTDPGQFTTRRSGPPLGSLSKGRARASANRRSGRPQ